MSLRLALKVCGKESDIAQKAAVQKEARNHKKRSIRAGLSGPISHDIAIVSLRSPPIARYFLSHPSNPPTGCDTPLWCLVLHRHISAIPQLATYRAMLVRYPPPRKHRKGLSPGFRATRLSRRKKGGSLWRYSAYFPVFKAEKGPKKNLRQTLVTSDTRVSLVKVLPKKQARNSFAILSLKASRDMKSIAAGPP